MPFSQRPQGGERLKKAVISLGGSILIRDDDDPTYIRKLVENLMKEDVERYIIVTGGGRTARRYIGLGRDLEVDEATLDMIGIEVTRLHAWLMIGALGEMAYPRPFRTVEEAIIGAAGARFCLGGGTHPGHTTDAVSALIAERWKADLFVNMTAVNGAFTADPNIEPEAERIDRMTSKELVELVSMTTRVAGSHSVMDPLASEIIHRSSIRTRILNGRDLDSLVACIRGQPFDGTVIEPFEGG